MSNYEPDFHDESGMERSMPASPDTERATLGAIILDNALIAQAMELLEEDDFYVPSHRKIFFAMVSLFMVGEQIDPMTVANEMEKNDTLQFSGGIIFLTDLTSGLPHISSLESYARIIKGKSILRKLIKEAARISAEAFDGDDEPKEILERAGKGIFGITMETMTKTFSRINVLSHRALHKAHLISEQGSAITGVGTGFTNFDALTLGFQKSDLIILAARPSMGKTAMAVDWAAYAAIDLGLTVVFFSLEMSEEQITNRILCSRARVDSQRFRSGHLNNEEWGRLNAVDAQLATAKLFIDDTPGITPLRMKAKCRRLAAEHGEIHLGIGDYVQLMGNDGSRKAFSREQEVSQNSRELKGMAKELNMPWVILSQLSRAPENRTDHRPQLSDLRESGSIEQDADLVAFIYREDKYKNFSEAGQEPSHVAELLLSKQRNGPTGMAALRFDDATGHFQNLFND